MTEDDLDAVLPVEQALHPFPWTRGNFVDSLRAGHVMWIADEADGMVGYAITTQVLDESHLLNISVLPARQRGGRGATLLQYLCDNARGAGATRMFLEVRPSNHAAQRLYLRHRFVEVGRRKGYYPGRDGREDAIVMVRDLSG